MASVCLDPGHGGKDSGATGYGRLEKNDVLNMAKRVGEILSGWGYRVYYTRTTDVYESPIQKAREANSYKVDFFASFHRNAANGTACGFETLVYSNTGKAKICADSANAAMQALGFKNRGTKVRRDLTVLNSTNMPAVLFEIGFIDNKTDNAIFVNRFEQIAQGLATAIAKALGSAPKPVTPLVCTYAAKIEGGKILPFVTDTNDYAGIIGKKITGLVIKVNKGSVKYRAHTIGGGWGAWVTGCDWNDNKNGWVGKSAGYPIDAVQVVLTDAGERAQYRVSPLKGNYYSWQYNIETSGAQDGWAGSFGKAIDRFQIT